MKKMNMLAAAAAISIAAFAGEHDTPETAADHVRLTCGEQVYAGNVAIVGTNGLAYAVNTAAVAGGTACGVFLHSADKGAKVLAKRGGFVLENAGNVSKADVGATVWSVTNNAWTVTKTSGSKVVGKVADVVDGKVVVVVGR